MFQFVCDVAKDTGKEEYLRPFIRIGLDTTCVHLGISSIAEGELKGREAAALVGSRHRTVSAKYFMTNDHETEYGEFCCSDELLLF